MTDASALVIWLHGLCLCLKKKALRSCLRQSSSCHIQQLLVSTRLSKPVLRPRTLFQEPAAAALGEMDAARLRLLAEIASEHPR